MLDDLYRSIQRLVQSSYLPYLLAVLFIAIWWAANLVVGRLRGGREAGDEPRPRRRLPLG